MSPSADPLLQFMKHQVDRIVATDEKLQQFLLWVNQKALSVKLVYKPAAVRAFYLAFALDRKTYEIILDTKLAHRLSRDLTNDVGDVLNSKSDRDRASTLVLDCSLLFELRLARDHALGGSGASKYALEPELKRSLKQLQETLKDQQPNLIKDTKGYRLWWKNDGQVWTEQLKDLMIKYRNIGHDWQLNKQQKEILDQYYDANLLLVECLNSDCYVSREVRQDIEDTLLLPITEIEQRKRGLI
jgi:predicted NACHT family NTPase